MPSAPDGSPSAVSTPSSGRRIFSRIASPFAASPRAISEFSITVNDEHKHYSPGDVVSGSVTVRTARPTRITHMVVSLHGFVQVYKNPGTPAESRQSPARLHKTGDTVGNGFATLFDDEEQVLCGDGKLTEGTFRFEFELEFPDQDLPSSIDFERGTITYVVTATLTRPTTISPVMVTERKIYFVERVDISQVTVPKPRTITLEPLQRRSKTRNHARRRADQLDRTGQTPNSSRQSSDPPAASRTPSVPSTHNDSGIPDSPSRSDVSMDGSINNALASPSDSQYPQSMMGSDSGTLNNSKISLANKIITATVGPEAGGCLRGDSVSVKVHVTHTKHIKSLYGVIVTFYRQARTDMNPSVPLGSVEKGKAQRYEDYYPKSITGFGGLSLSGAGSNHVFRKDLSQVMMPLMVDPVTLTAEVNAKVRVPEDAFPTISTVPGGMISFRYYVEVVLDIQGKLAGQDRGIASLPGLLPDHVMLAESSNMERSAYTPFGSTIVDTFPVRREKSVVTSTFEIIVGTRDSERRKGKRKATLDPTPNNHNSPPPPADQRGQRQTREFDHDSHLAQPGPDVNNYNHYDQNYAEGDGYWYDPQYHDPQWYHYGYPYEHYGNNTAGGTENQYYYTHDPSYESHDYFHSPPPPIPLPQMPDESRMTEKERVRQAETRLLPSRPPVDVESDGAVNGIDDATAPTLSDDGEYGGHPSTSASAPSFDANGLPSSSSSVATPTFPLPLHTRPFVIPASQQPTSASSTRTALASSDDKQELQRRQLQAEASAPPIDGADGRDGRDGVSGESSAAAGETKLPASSSHNHEPSAPTLDEADAGELHDSHADALPSASGLPRYER